MTVLIIGANPIGLILAYQLTCHHIPIRIIDFRKDPSDQLDESNEPILLSPNTLSILKALNLLENPLFSHRLLQGFSYFWKNISVQSNPRKNDEMFPHALLTSKNNLEKYLLTHLEKLNIEVEWETKPIALVEDKLFTEKTIPQQELGERKTSQETWIVACEANNNPYLLELMKIHNKSHKSFKWFSSQCFSTTALSIQHIHTLPFLSNSPRYIFPSFNYDTFNQFQLVSQNQSLSQKEKEYLEQYFHFSESEIDQKFFSYIQVNLPLQYTNILFVGHKSFNSYNLFPLNINIHIQAVLNLSWKLILSLRKASTKSLVYTYDQEVNLALKLTAQKIKTFSKQTLFTQKWFSYFFYWKIKANSLKKDRKEHLFNKLSLQYSKTLLLNQNNKDKQWKGPRSGSLAPNCLLQKDRFLLDPIQGKKHLLLFFKENKALSSALYEEYGEWLEIVCSDEKNIKDMYHASENTLYIIRPDYIIGYRSQNFKIKEIVTYLLKVFKDRVYLNSNSINQTGETKISAVR